MKHKNMDIKNLYVSSGYTPKWTILYANNCPIRDANNTLLIEIFNAKISINERKKENNKQPKNTNKKLLEKYKKAIKPGIETKLNLVLSIFW